MWLDAKKERSELRPARLVHRAAECLEDVEASREDKAPIVQDLIGKVIKVGGSRVGFSCGVVDQLRTREVQH